MTWIKIFFIILIIVLVYEFIQGYNRQLDRYTYYKMAQKKAKELNRPLVVYGDPYNGTGSKIYNNFLKTYGCGDETVDLTGCPKCPNGKKQDMLENLKSKPDNSCVVFVSCVLEYIDDIDDIISEILRVAGDWKNVFIVTVNEHTLSAYLYKDKNDMSRNIVYAPPKYRSITYKKVKSPKHYQ